MQLIPNDIPTAYRALPIVAGCWWKSPSTSYCAELSVWFFRKRCQDHSSTPAPRIKSPSQSNFDNPETCLKICRYLIAKTSFDMWTVDEFHPLPFPGEKHLTWACPEDRWIMVYIREFCIKTWIRQKSSSLHLWFVVYFLKKDTLMLVMRYS